MELGLDIAGVGDGVTTGVATTIATEDLVPANVVFSVPTPSTGLVIGDLGSGEVHALWVKRVVPVSTITMELFDTSSIVMQIFT